MSPPPNYSDVIGTVFTNGSAKENVYVEAYHDAAIPMIPLYYLGTSIAPTDENGKFTIIFPDNPYGVIKWPFEFPNIVLKVVDQYSVLFTESVRYAVTPSRNKFEIKIPSNFIYSNKINHVNWDKLIMDVIVDMSGMPYDKIKDIIPGFVHSTVQSKYSLPASWDNLDYRGAIVPEIPKTMDHNHSIPWYLDWHEGEDQ